MPTMVSSLILFVASVLSSPQKQLPMPAFNVPAPKLAKMEALQGKNLSAYEPGKVYVIEFWATWCAPCVGAIKHVNELANSMKGKPVEFYSITKESGEMLNKFMKKYQFDTNVLSDKSGGTFEAFGIQVIPRTAIIDKTGKLVVITSPELVTSKALEDLLAGKKVNIEAKFNKISSFDWDADMMANSLGHAYICASDSDGGGYKAVPNSGCITGDGISIQNIAQITMGSDFSSTIWEFEPDPFKYRVSVKAPDKSDSTAKAMLGEVAHRLMNFDAKWEMVEREVFVLEANGRINLTPTKGPSLDGFAHGGEIRWPNCDMDTLAKHLASFIFGKTVVNESGVAGKFDIDLKWIPGDKADVTSMLEKVGLKVTPGKRSVRTLIVRKATP